MTVSVKAFLKSHTSGSIDNFIGERLGAEAASFKAADSCLLEALAARLGGAAANLRGNTAAKAERDCTAIAPKQKDQWQASPGAGHATNSTTVEGPFSFTPGSELEKLYKEAQRSGGGVRGFIDQDNRLRYEIFRGDGTVLYSAALIPRTREEIAIEERRQQEVREKRQRFLAESVPSADNGFVENIDRRGRLGRARVCFTHANNKGELIWRGFDAKGNERFLNYATGESLSHEEVHDLSRYMKLPKGYPTIGDSQYNLSEEVPKYFGIPPLRNPEVIFDLLDPYHMSQRFFRESADHAVFVLERAFKFGVR